MPDLDGSSCSRCGAGLRRQCDLERCDALGVAAVVTGAVGVPDVDEHVWHRLAGLDVDDADVDELARQRSRRRPTHEELAQLKLGHVLAHRVTDIVVVWSLRGRRREDASRVANLGLARRAAGQDLLALGPVLVQRQVRKVIAALVDEQRVGRSRIGRASAWDRADAGGQDALSERPLALLDVAGDDGIAVIEAVCWRE